MTEGQMILSLGIALQHPDPKEFAWTANGAPLSGTAAGIREQPGVHPLCYRFPSKCSSQPVAFVVLQSCQNTHFKVFITTAVKDFITFNNCTLFISVLFLFSR